MLWLKIFKAYIYIRNFRERLHKANHEAFDVELNILSKQAILQAWENRTKEDEAKYSEVIERLRQDSIEEVRVWFSTSKLVIVCM
jgi:hypothetical protein